MAMLWKALGLCVIGTILASALKKTSPPMALLVTQKMPSNLPVAVQAATTVVPKRLTAVWMIMLERLYMEPCTAEGMPSVRIRRREPGWIRSSRHFNCQGPRARLRCRRISSAEKLRDSTVAQATPATPQEKTATKSRSSPMFSTQQTARKNSGHLESPMERRMPEPMLNSSRAVLPR